MKRIFLCSVILFNFIICFAQQNSTLMFPNAVMPRSIINYGRGDSGLASTEQYGMACFNNISSPALMKSQFDCCFGYQYLVNNFITSPSYIIGMDYKVSPSFALSLGFVYSSENVRQFSSRNTNFYHGVFGVSYLLFPGISIGGSLKMNRYTLISDSRQKSYNLVVGDVYATYSYRSFNASLGVANFGQSIVSQYNRTFMSPVNIALGLSYKCDIDINNALEFTCDSRFYIPVLSPFVSLGAEYSYENTYFVRAGINYNNKELPSTCNLGLGYQFNGYRMDVFFGYLYLQKKSITAGLSISYSLF